VSATALAEVITYENFQECELDAQSRLGNYWRMMNQTLEQRHAGLGSTIVGDYIAGERGILAAGLTGRQPKMVTTWIRDEPTAGQAQVGPVPHHCRTCPPRPSLQAELDTLGVLRSATSSASSATPAGASPGSRATRPSGPPSPSCVPASPVGFHPQ
jgi:hypothetical protein